MIDVQCLKDTRNMAVNRVGMKNLRYPVTGLGRTNQIQHTVDSERMESIHNHDAFARIEKKLSG